MSRRPRSKAKTGPIAGYPRVQVSIEKSEPDALMLEEPYASQNINKTCVNRQSLAMPVHACLFGMIDEALVPSRRGPERGFGALDALVVPGDSEPREVVDVGIVRDIRDHALVDPHEEEVHRHLHQQETLRKLCRRRPVRPFRCFRHCISGTSRETTTGDAQ